MRQRIAAIRRSTATLQDVAAKVAADTTWLAHLNAWHQTLTDELAAISQPTRDPVIQRQAESLSFAIRSIDSGLTSTIGPIVSLSGRLGDLMHAAGYATSGPDFLSKQRGWLGSTRETEQRLAALSVKHAYAQADLAEALLDDTARAARDAARLEHARVFNAMTKAERRAALSSMSSS